MHALYQNTPDFLEEGRHLPSVMAPDPNNILASCLGGLYKSGVIKDRASMETLDVSVFSRRQDLFACFYQKLDYKDNKYAKDSVGDSYIISRWYFNANRGDDLTHGYAFVGRMLPWGAFLVDAYYKIEPGELVDVLSSRLINISAIRTLRSWLKEQTQYAIPFPPYLDWIDYEWGTPPLFARTLGAVLDWAGTQAIERDGERLLPDPFLLLAYDTREGRARFDIGFFDDPRKVMAFNLFAKKLRATLNVVYDAFGPSEKETLFRTMSPYVRSGNPTTFELKLKDLDCSGHIKMAQAQKLVDLVDELAREGAPQKLINKLKNPFVV